MLRRATLIAAAILATAHQSRADAIADCSQSRNTGLRVKACTEVALDRTADAETRATALRHRAAANVELRIYDKALADLTEALKLKPDYGLALLARGQVKLSMKDVPGALPDLDQAVRLMPTSAAAYNARGYAHLTKGYLDNAQADFTQAIALDPRSASARNNRGLTYRRKQQLGEAIADYTEALRINPSYALAYANRAHAYEAWGKPQEAAADYARAAELDPALRTARSGARQAGTEKRIAQAAGISASRGKVIAEKNCAWCHGIGATGISQNPRAPEFRALYLRHPLESLREPLSRRIATPHAEMPTFTLADDEVDSIIAYINSITPRGR